MNVLVAQSVLQKLYEAGTKTLCLCPGARNAPFVELLSKNSDFEVLSFYDERSAGFFALGRSQRDKNPVAILTTSGTAVSELLSPIIEAYYTKTPLVVVSSDRPKRLRGTGAPQAIEQSHLFSKHVEGVWDLESEPLSEFHWSGEGPIHINLCFDEPLVDEPVAKWSCSDGPKKEKPQKQLESYEGSLNFEKSFVIVGGLKEVERENIASQLKSIDVPIFLEAASGLRGLASLEDKILLGCEKMASQLVKSGELQSVVRLGDVPLGRFWRDLDQTNIPVTSFSEKPWRGTGSSKLFQVNLKKIDFDIKKFFSLGLVCLERARTKKLF